MTNYPQEIIEIYRKRQISKEEFVKQLTEWQRGNGLDYSYKITVNGSNVYFTYRNITAKIKNNTLHFKTSFTEVAKTPFEFRRKVDFYYTYIKKAKHYKEDSVMILHKTKDVPEKIVIQQVKEIIEITGIKLQRINTGCFAIGSKNNRRYIKTANAGTCDFEGYDKFGRFVAIECKRPVGGKISPAQKERIDDINSKGGIAFIVHSGNEALALLQANNCI